MWLLFITEKVQITFKKKVEIYNYNKLTIISNKKNIHTIKPVLRGHLWDKEKKAL